MSKIIEGKLFDVDIYNKESKEIPVKVEIENGKIFICPEGYGDYSSQDGHGSPLMIEIWDGELRVVAWADINEEDPTAVIGLEGAREELREEYYFGYNEHEKAGEFITKWLKGEIQ